MRHSSLDNRYAIAVARAVLVAATVLVVVYLALLALSLVPSLGWFGRPDTGSVPTTVVVATLIAAVCVLSYRAHVARRPGAIPVGVIAILALISGVLALSSYAGCSDGNHPAFFYMLMWTASTVKGGIDDHQLVNGLCPSPAPVALHVARLAGMSALYVGVISIVVALLTSQLDRARLALARSITAIVDVDDDSRSMVTAVARTLEPKSRLAVIVAAAHVGAVGELRSVGARIVGVEFADLDGLESLPLWNKLDKLYLLSADPSANLVRLAAINRRMPPGRRNRLPLILRIDDPWQAEAWRAQQLGGSDRRWAADAVGVHEITAGRLLDRILNDGQTTKIIVCGTSALTLALCGNLVRRRLERNFYAAPGTPPLPTVTIVADDAEEYRRDHEFHQQQLGLPSDTDWLDAINARPTVSELASLIARTQDGPTHHAAVIMVTDQSAPGADSTVSTRLAARFPTLPIFARDVLASEVGDVDTTPIIGQLRTFRPAMNTPTGQAQDAWERAAMLMHERYAPLAPPSQATRPWNELDEFYRGSNRRAVRNALWMVEQIAGHTWDTFGAAPDPPALTQQVNSDPLQRLCAMGFDHNAVLAMAEAEHEDWVRYYRKAEWRYGPKRDDTAKVHPNLVSWDAMRSDQAAVNTALNSLATTLYALGQLGYRSRPQWQRFRRTGVVTAHRRDKPWSWTTGSGETMQADAGDWAVSDDDGHGWSVRNDIFRSTYEHVDGNRWRRIGLVDVRPARDGEAVQTLEGTIVARAPAWVVKGTQEEQWVVAAHKFDSQYEAAPSQ
jgi:RyR domain